MNINFKDKRFIIYLVLAILILTALFARIWAASTFPYFEDEVMSINAASGIVKHGLPVLRTGKIYSRSLLGHYLLSVPIYFFGVNEFSTRIVSIILSVILLPIVFVMGKDLYDEYVGVLTVFLLVFSKREISHAVSARFYMIFQFFFIITLFLFYKGFVEENNKYKPWCILSFLCATFTHRFSIVLAIIFLAFLLITKNWKWLKDKYLLVGLGLLGAAHYFTFFYQFPNTFINRPVPALQVGSLTNKLSLFNQLDRIVLHSLSIIILGMLYLYFEKDKKLFYYYLSFFLGVTAISLVAPMGSPRYTLNLFPIYLLLLSYCIVRLSKSIYHACHPAILKLTGNSKTHKVAIVTILLMSSFWLFIRVCENADFGYYLPRPDLQPAHTFIQKNIRKGDILISTNPDITEIYFRIPDYFLRQKPANNYWSRNNKNWGEWSFKFDEHRGYYMLDNVAKLNRLMENKDHQLWIYTDGKLPWTVGPELIKFVRKNLDEVFHSAQDGTQVYLWSNG